MKKSLRRPAMIAAGAVATSLFLLLCMARYGAADYLASGGQRQDVLPFRIAALLVEPFGAGAFLGTGLLLAWSVIFYFKESVGAVLPRVVGLATLVPAFCAMTSLGSEPHEFWAGSVGIWAGNVLYQGFGPVLGWTIVGTLFMVSLALATDMGFHRQFAELRSSLSLPLLQPDEGGVAVLEEEPPAGVDTYILDPELPAPRSVETPPLSSPVQRIDRDAYLADIRSRIHSGGMVTDEELDFLDRSQDVARDGDDEPAGPTLSGEAEAFFASMGQVAGAIAERSEEALAADALPGSEDGAVGLAEEDDDVEMVRPLEPIPDGHCRVIALDDINIATTETEEMREEVVSRTADVPAVPPHSSALPPVELTARRGSGFFSAVEFMPPSEELADEPVAARPVTVPAPSSVQVADLPSPAAPSAPASPAAAAPAPVAGDAAPEEFLSESGWLVEDEMFSFPEPEQEAELEAEASVAAPVEEVADEVADEVAAEVDAFVEAPVEEPAAVEETPAPAAIEEPAAEAVAASCEVELHPEEAVADDEPVDMDLPGDETAEVYPAEAGDDAPAVVVAAVPAVEPVETPVTAVEPPAASAEEMVESPATGFVDEVYPLHLPDGDEEAPVVEDVVEAGAGEQAPLSAELRASEMDDDTNEVLARLFGEPVVRSAEPEVEEPAAEAAPVAAEEPEASPAPSAHAEASVEDSFPAFLDDPQYSHDDSPVDLDEEVYLHPAVEDAPVAEDTAVETEPAVDTRSAVEAEPAVETAVEEPEPVLPPVDLEEAVDAITRSLKDLFGDDIEETEAAVEETEAEAGEETEAAVDTSTGTLFTLDDDAGEPEVEAPAAPRRRRTRKPAKKAEALFDAGAAEAEATPADAGAAVEETVEESGDASAEEVETPAVDEDKVDRIVERFRSGDGGEVEVAPSPVVPAAAAPSPTFAPVASGDRDALYDEAVAAVQERGRGSVVVLQRRLGIGFTRATRLLEELMSGGVIGPENESGSHPLL